MLETPRLVLRPQRPDDAEIQRRLWTERDPRVPPHRRIDDQGRPTVEDLASWLSTRASQPGPGLLAIERRAEGDVIGYCGLVASDEGNGTPDEPELAYELLGEVHGRGYATEAGRAVVQWATEASYRRLWAGVWDWNVASRRVLSKLGFREVGRVAPASVHGHSLLTELVLSPAGAPPHLDRR